MDRPDREFIINRIILVNPVVAVIVISGKFGKTVSRARAKELAAIGDHTVVIDIKGKETVARSDYGQDLFIAVRIKIK